MVVYRLLRMIILSHVLQVLEKTTMELMNDTGLPIEQFGVIFRFFSLRIGYTVGAKCLRHGKKLSGRYRMMISS